MIIRSNNMRVEKRMNMRDGKGEIKITHLLEKDLLKGEARLFAKITIPPNSSIGLHEHKGEFEIFYILSGEGIFHDNGKNVPVKAGDICLTDSGEVHSIENTSNKDLELLAVIILH